MGTLSFEPALVPLNRANQCFPLVGRCHWFEGLGFRVKVKSFGLATSTIQPLGQETNDICPQAGNDWFRGFLVQWFNASMV